MEQEATQLEAVERVLDSKNELVGLVLAIGNFQKQVFLDDCVLLARNNRITNIRAVKKGRESILIGNGIELEALPSEYI